MHLIYNSVAMDVMTIDRFFWDTVYDDSGIDPLYQKVEILVTAMVNGQSEVRTVSGPPISYTASGNGFRGVQAAATAPGAATAPVVGTNTDPGLVPGALRQYGAARVSGTGSLGLQTIVEPLYGDDLQIVETIAPGPGSPITTLQLISKRLTSPRAPLFVFSGKGANPGQLLWQSPNSGALCDAKGGPKPTSFGITHCFADGVTFFVTFGIESYLQLSAKTAKDPLLSNRFMMSHVIDEDSFLTIQTVGRAVFDLGVLQNNSQNPKNANPDTYRPNLFLPIPQGFVRQNITVLQSADGTSIDYNFSDVESRVSFAGGPYVNATKCEAIHRQFIVCDTDILEGITATTNTILNNAWARKALKEKPEPVTHHHYHYPHPAPTP